MSRESQAMQRDDTANPGMLWVLEGETLWNEKAGFAGRSCADCHGDAGRSMRGLAARYPAYLPEQSRPVDLEGRINLCRETRQNAPPLPRENREILALAAYVAHQSRGHADHHGRGSAAGAVPHAGRGALSATAGPVEFFLRQLSRRQLGQAAGGQHNSSGTPDRLSVVPLRMAEFGSLQRGCATAWWASAPTRSPPARPKPWSLSFT